MKALFTILHRRRTRGEPKVIVGGPGDIGRKDQYVKPYAGREYGPREQPFKVLPMGMQQLFYPVWGEEYLDKMIRDDPKMADLLIGLLFHYDP